MVKKIMARKSSNRTETIRVYVTEFEKTLIENKADEESMPLSTYCRRVLLGKD